MRDAVEDERLGGLAETDLLVEAFRVFLGLDVDDRCTEVFPGRRDALQHDPLAIPFAAFGGDDTPDGDLLHVRPGRADPTQGDDLAAFRQPQVDGRLVIPVHVLVDAVLLHDENLAADPQEFVEFVHRQFGKRFLMEYDSHNLKDKD